MNTLRRLLRAAARWRDALRDAAAGAVVPTPALRPVPVRIRRDPRRRSV